MKTFDRLRQDYARDRVGELRTTRSPWGRAMQRTAMSRKLRQLGNRLLLPVAAVLSLGLLASGLAVTFPGATAAPREWLAVALPKSPAAPRERSAPAVYYRNCNAARAAGAAPIYIGQPGFRPELDGDSDGIACEPLRGSHSHRRR